MEVPPVPTLPFPPHNCPLGNFSFEVGVVPMDDLPLVQPLDPAWFLGRSPWAQPTISVSIDRQPGNRSGSRVLPGASDHEVSHAGILVTNFQPVGSLVLAGACVLAGWGGLVPEPYAARVEARPKARGQRRSGRFRRYSSAWPGQHSIPTLLKLEGCLF